jgi:hypothetical protein
MKPSNFLGYTSFTHYVHTTFSSSGVDTKLLLTNSFLIGFFLETFDFIESYIWYSSSALLFLLGVMTADWVFAVVRAVKKAKRYYERTGEIDPGGGFSTSKAMHFMMKLVSIILVLTFLFNLSPVLSSMKLIAVEPTMVAYFSKVAYLYLLMVNAISTLVHMNMLGLLPSKFATFLTKYFDLHKVKMEKDLDQMLEKTYKDGIIQSKTDRLPH